MQKGIGIIGFGNMGSAIAEQLKDKYQIFVFDKDENKTRDLSSIYVSRDIDSLLARVDTVILAVKPQDFDALVSKIKDLLANKLVVSIAAGISTEYIQKELGKVRIIRSMPNLPAKIGRGMICICRGQYATGNDLKFARELFLNLGTILEVDESMMDSATAISGSGPGFLYAFLENREKSQWPDFLKEKFIPKLSESALKAGFRQEEAKILANHTACGSLALLEQTGLGPQDLRMQVTSKGGTTEAGLKKLDVNNVESLLAACEAALLKVKSLSR
ncbi:MAG: pyrroline-5-carboxylate reductase [Candidatus Omnitrophica bacterium]|nr:pyrroline-5-carboxylate reductase [Candidatus Omnitrophota bacterium]